MTAPDHTSPSNSEVVFLVSGSGSAKANRETWTGLVEQTFQKADVRSADWESFTASMRIRALGERSLILVEHSGLWQTSVSPSLLSAPRSDQICVAVCLKGKIAFDHEGSRAIVNPGEAAIIDFLRVHRSRGDEPTKFLCLNLNRIDLGQALKVLEGPLIVIKPDEPIGAVTIDMIRRAWKLLPSLDGSKRERLTQRLGQMVAESVICRSPKADIAGTHVMAMVYRAKMIVMRRVREPDFGAQALADAMGVTRRYLGILFRTIDDTPSDYIHRIRLHIAWDLLTDARCELPIAGIAAAVGLGNGSQFAKAVGSAFLQTPLEIRKGRLK